MAEPLYEPIPPHELPEGMAELELEPWKERYYQDPRFDLDREELAGWEGGELEFLETFQDYWEYDPNVDWHPPEPVPGATAPSEEMRNELWGRIEELRGGEAPLGEREAAALEERLRALAMRDLGGPIRIGTPEQFDDWKNRQDPLNPLASPNIPETHAPRPNMRWSFAGEEQWREALPGGVPSTPGSVMHERETQRQAMAQGLERRQQILAQQAEQKRAQDEQMRQSAQQLIRQHVPHVGGFFGGR